MLTISPIVVFVIAVWVAVVVIKWFYQTSKEFAEEATETPKRPRYIGELLIIGLTIALLLY